MRTGAVLSAPRVRERVRLHVVILAVEDLARSVAFYRALLASDPVVESPSYVEIPTGSLARVGLYARAGFERNTAAPASGSPASGTTSTEIYLRVDDLDAAILRLRAAGARELAPRASRNWGDDAAYFADPDGNVVAVARPTARPFPS